MVAAEADVELACFEAFRGARAGFHRALIEHAQRHVGRALHQQELELLRSEATYAIAEFYFAADAYGLVKDAALVRGFVERHNKKIERFLADTQKLKELGLTLRIVEESRIGSKSAENIISNSRRFKSRYIVMAQGTLQSCLFDTVAKETCRLTIIALRELGLVDFDPGTAPILIETGGILEEYFRNSLTKVVRSLNLMPS